jgi:hypothetical protein
MKALQDRVDSLSAAQGIPADPTAAAVQNLRDHVLARIDANPYRKEELAELREAVKDLADNPTTKDTDLVRTILGEVRGHLEGLDYLKELGNALHKQVLKNA